jgi:hypothetical protein
MLLDKSILQDQAIGQLQDSVGMLQSAVQALRDTVEVVYEVVGQAISTLGSELDRLALAVGRDIEEVVMMVQEASYASILRDAWNTFGDDVDRLKTVLSGWMSEEASVILKMQRLSKSGLLEEVGDYSNDLPTQWYLMKADNYVNVVEVKRKAIWSWASYLGAADYGVALESRRWTTSCHLHAVKSFVGESHADTADALLKGRAVIEPAGSDLYCRQGGVANAPYITPSYFESGGCGSTRYGCSGPTVCQFHLGECGDPVGALKFGAGDSPHSFPVKNNPYSVTGSTPLANPFYQKSAPRTVPLFTRHQKDVFRHGLKFGLVHGKYGPFESFTLFESYEKASATSQLRVMRGMTGPEYLSRTHCVISSECYYESSKGCCAYSAGKVCVNRTSSFSVAVPVNFTEEDVAFAVNNYYRTNVTVLHITTVMSSVYVINRTASYHTVVLISNYSDLELRTRLDDVSVRLETSVNVLNESHKTLVTSIASDNAIRANLGEQSTRISNLSVESALEWSAIIGTSSVSLWILVFCTINTFILICGGHYRAAAIAIAACFCSGPVVSSPASVALGSMITPSESNVTYRPSATREKRLSMYVP